MNEIRRALVSEEGVSDEMPPDVRFLSAREGALIGLYVDHVELYEHLITRYHREGTSEALRAIALDAAGNLSTILQSLRSRQDLVTLLEQVPDRPGIPLLVIDQLFHCFTLLTAPVSEDDEAMLLTAAEAHEILLDDDLIRDWLLRAGVVPRRQPAAGG